MAYPTDSGVTYTTKTDNVDVINASDVNNLQTETSAIKTLLGTIGSVVSGTFYYLMSEITGSDKAVGKTATQTLTNKTLTSPVINVGSDATGDMYYRNAGVLTRIPIGTDNQILKLNGTTPNWETEATLYLDDESIAYGTGNKSVTQTGLQKASEIYGADAGANDTYAITLSPAPTSYSTGMTIHFKANTANTGSATLNINSLGAKTLKKEYNVDLDTGDILANQLVTVIYDGTNFQVISPLPVKTYNANITISSSTTTTITCGFRPKLIRISAFNGNTNYGVTSSNGSYSVAQATNRCTYITYASGGNTFGVATDTTNCVNLAYGTGTTTVTALINNITGTGFDIVSTVSGGTAYCSYEVIG